MRILQRQTTDKQWSFSVVTAGGKRSRICAWTSRGPHNRGRPRPSPAFTLEEGGALAKPQVQAPGRRLRTRPRTRRGPGDKRSLEPTARTPGPRLLPGADRVLWRRGSGVGDGGSQAGPAPLLLLTAGNLPGGSRAAGPETARPPPVLLPGARSPPPCFLLPVGAGNQRGTAGAQGAPAAPRPAHWGSEPGDGLTRGPPPRAIPASCAPWPSGPGRGAPSSSSSLVSDSEAGGGAGGVEGAPSKARGRLARAAVPHAPRSVDLG